MLTTLILVRQSPPIFSHGFSKENACQPMKPAASVEIKVRLRDRSAAERIVRSVADGPAEIVDQEDLFFRCTTGKLKLRILAPGRGELIAYERETGCGPRVSRYTIVPTDMPELLSDTLDRALGVTRRVRKRRTLYHIGQTRVHLDAVEGLGDFLELEVVLAEGQRTVEGSAIAANLMARIGIAPEELVDIPYVDLVRDSAAMQIDPEKTCERSSSA